MVAWNRNTTVRKNATTTAQPQNAVPRRQPTTRAPSTPEEVNQNSYNILAPIPFPIPFRVREPSSTHRPWVPRYQFTPRYYYTTAIKYNDRGGAEITKTRMDRFNRNRHHHHHHHNRYYDDDSDESQNIFGKIYDKAKQFGQMMSKGALNMVMMKLANRAASSMTNSLLEGRAMPMILPAAA